jgi:hypothetical protein
MLDMYLVRTRCDRIRIRGKTDVTLLICTIAIRGENASQRL